MIFIKVKEPQTPLKKENKTQKGIKRFVEFILPRANPQFDDKIDIVVFWLLEFINSDSIPSREIGLDENENVILKMPHLRNHGYWTDNNLTCVDFQKLFDSMYVTEEYFNTKWNSLL